MDKLNYEYPAERLTHALTRLELTDTQTATVEANVHRKRCHDGVHSTQWSQNIMFLKRLLDLCQFFHIQLLTTRVLTVIHNLLSHLSSEYIHS